MGFRSSLACLMAIVAVTTLASGCGGRASRSAHRPARTTTPSSASWMRLLPFDARVHAPPGAIGIATPEFPAMIVASAVRTGRSRSSARRGQTGWRDEHPTRRDTPTSRRGDSQLDRARACRTRRDDVMTAPTACNWVFSSA
jgi:hypothetical protein